MKKLQKALKGHKYICFLDFEGTQFTHEMIAFGAVFAYLKKDCTISKTKNSIKYIVQAKNKVGKFVENLTGLTDYDVKTRGIPFSQAVKEIKKYCGIHYTKTLFVTFGNHDFRIFNQSIAYNLDISKDMCTVIQKNFFDFQGFIMEFCKDDCNNPYSLENYLKLYGVEFEGQVHDPEYDALNLMLLYKAFLEKKDITLREYMKILARGNNLPAPVKEAVYRLVNGETISPEEFKKIAKEYIS